MTPTEVKLIEVLKKGLKLRRESPVLPSTAIGRGVPAGVDTLGLDSVDVLEIAVLLDKHFGVQLEEENEDVRGALASVGALAGYIDRRGGAAHLL